MTVSRRIPVLFGGLALAAASLLAPDEARAQRDQCGALDAQGAATCSDQAYAGGIRYDVADGWNDGVAGPVTLTVTGGSATTISAPASPPNDWTDGAIVIRTAPQGTGDSTSRAVALTVGSGSNAVAIAEHATQTNHGIIVFQFGKAADAAAVTLGSGVVIGTASAPMKHYGVHVLATESTNTAAHSIVSAATIHSQGFGLLMDARGSGSTTVTNSGSITTYAAGGNAGEKSGIRVLDWTGTYGDDRTADTTTTVTNSGSVTVGGANTHGVHVNADGLGLYKIVHSGTVSASGAGGHGIYVQASRHAGAAGSEAVAVESSGAVTATGAGGHGILVDGSSGPDPGDGNIAVTTTGGTISATGEGALGILAANASDGTITVTNAAAIEAAADGIQVGKNSANKGAMRIVNTAAIEAKRYGIVVWHGGAGDVRIENSGAIAPASGASPARVGILADQAAAGDVVIANGAAVTGSEQGIFARNTEGGTDGGGAVTVTHSAGEVSGGTGEGILAVIGRWRDEDGTESPAPNSAATVRVEVTGGSVKASETHGRAAIAALNHEGGSAEVSVSQGVTVTARHNVGIYAQLADRQNTGGRIEISQAGAIVASGGIYASVPRASAAGETRAAAAQPLIDVAWTGTFTQAERAASSWNNVAHAIEGAQEDQAGEAIRGAATWAGIDAEVLSWRVLNRIATTGDDPGEIADAAAQMNLLSETHADSRRAAILTRFRTVLTAGTATIPGADDIDGDDDDSYSDAELVAYLSEDSAARRTLLRDVLARDLSGPEKAVLRALATGAGLETALAGVTGASDAWKAEVRALAGWYNVGNVRVAMTGGAIDTRGDGIRAWYAKPHDMNGAIAVTVAEGARVTGGAAGIYVANAGLGLRIAKKYTPPAIQEMEANRNLGPDDLVTLQTYRNQVVRVDGTVTGGSDAAIHLAGGGALIVDGEGKLVAGAGRPAVLVNDPAPAIIYIAGETTGSEGAEAAVHLTGGGYAVVGLTGGVDPNGAPLAIRIDRPPGDTTPSGVFVHVPSGRAAPLTRQGTAAALKRAGISASKNVGVGGNAVGDNITVVEAMIVNGREQTTTVRVDLELDSRGVPMLGPDLPNESFRCRETREAMDRCRLYRALPSALLAMTGLPGRTERMSAARDGAGGWALVEATSGKWTAAGPAAATAQDKLTYRHSRFGIRAGADVAATGENVRLGVSAHGFRGSAKTPSSGTAKLSGAGLGVYAAAAFDDGLHVDVQAAATWYDADVDAPDARKNDAMGRGYAASLELGRSFAASGGMTVVPRAGLLWSSASLDSFEDVAKSDTAAPATVSVKDASRLTGSVGVGVESVVDDGARLFGSLDVSQELSGRMEASVSEETLKSTARKTTVRAGVGGLFDLGDGASLRASAGYATAGSGNDEFGGGLSLDVRF